MSSEIAIKVENLSKCYQIYDQPRDRLKQFILPHLQRSVGRPSKQYFREFWSLKNVSFEIKKGEMVGIIGRNGSGKSTLLQMICGTLNPSHGNIQTVGRIAALLELGSGFNPEFTGRENVYLNGAVLGLNKEEIDARFDGIVAFADIGDFLEQPVKTYSSGMVVRLAFAVAVSVQPNILVVDEALAVGDEAFQRKCFTRISEIRKAGGTILFVTHSTQTIVEMCDRAILLRQGEMVYFGQSHRTVNLYYKTIGKSSDSYTLEMISQEMADLDSKNYNENTLPKDTESALEDQRDGNSPADHSLKKLEFDASLVSQTKHEIHEKKYGVTLSNISLLNLSENEINILSSDERYVLTFEVSLTQSPTNISYQILFKTVNGIPISGDRFFHERTFGAPAAAGDKFRIRYEFQCLMKPGVYFISVEACGDEENQNVVYHKFSETLAYRVIAKGGSTTIGYMSVMPHIEKRGF